MGSTDWVFLNNGLDAASVARGVTSDPDPGPPNGGGAFIYGFDSKVETEGAVGLTLEAVANPNHAPCVKGASIRAAVQRGVSSLKTGFSPFVYACLQAAAPPAVTDRAYILGLEDSDPYRIVVVKGQIIHGVPAATTENSLLRSTATYVLGQWHHLRLDCIVEGTGDVLIRCYENDLSTNPVTAPEWSPIPGCELFTDDALGVNSGTLPFTDGYLGFGFASKQQGRRGYFDQLKTLRQL